MAKVENLIRKVVDPHDFKLVVSNIGVVPDFSALYTTNAGPYTGTVQVQLQDDHWRSSFDYMREVQEELGRDGDDAPFGDDATAGLTTFLTAGFSSATTSH